MENMLKILLILIIGGGVMGFTLPNFFYVGLMFFIRFLMIFSYGGGVEGGIIFSLFIYGGYDFYSYYLTMLRIWVIGLMWVSLGSVGGSMGVIFMFYFVLVILMGFFCVVNLLIFYFFFEVTLIPTFFIVIIWGSNLERVEAALYLLIYIMFISFPLLGYVMKIRAVNMTLDFRLLVVGGSINVFAGGVNL